MPDPVFHLVVGPNGAGKSVLYEEVIGRVTHLEFVNADRIAAAHWPGHELEHTYDAAALATARRRELIGERRSFGGETVFSHQSKLDLVRSAIGAGYLFSLHVVIVPEDLAVHRVRARVVTGGHDVPEEKIRSRYHRLWDLVAEAIGLVEMAVVYDNSRVRPAFREVAKFERGRLLGQARWPEWTPDPIRQLS